MAARGQQTPSGHGPLIKALIVQAPGTNCDVENALALERAGARCEVATIGELIADRERVLRFRILCFPGGFAHGDDIASARILATLCRLHLGDVLRRFVQDEGGYVLGICNGFQALVKLGLLPRQDAGDIRQEVTICHNDSGHYECRWVRLRVESSPCRFLPAGEILEMPVGHGEGKFVPGSGFDPLTSPLVALRYVDENGQPTLSYPANPNGSIAAVAGLTDPTGRVFGLMPHPDRSFLPWHHPQHLQRPVREDDMAGARVFRGLVGAARES